MKTRVTELLGIHYPIVQGGMAWVSDPALTAAVSNAGGLGVLASAGLSPTELREAIRATRALTETVFGVNIALVLPGIDNLVDLVIKERIRCVTFGGGNPGKYIPRLKDAGCLVVPVVPSVALARRLERAGADALIAEGHEAGGHVGKTTTLCLVPQVVDAVQVPVIAAGGIGDGRGLAAALALGAEGVQLGTILVVADECSVHERFKEAIIKAHDRATALTAQSVGAPVRALANRLTREYYRLESQGATREELERLGLGKLRRAVIEGDVEEGSVMVGQIAGLIRKRRPVATIFEEMLSEAETIIHRLGRRIPPNAERT
jgi:enoyl-[acyl-carrier protein] reductase II